MPHGLANAVLLAPVTRFNLPASACKLAHLKSALPPGSPSGAEGVLQVIDDLMRDLEIPRFKIWESCRRTTPGSPSGR